MLLWFALNHDDLQPLMIADLREYYQLDIKDLFRDESPVTPRDVSILLLELPVDSRVKRWLSKSQGEFSTDQHLMATIIDILNDVAFHSSITAAGTIGKEYRKVVKKRPKPIQRPMDPRREIETKPVRKFMSGKELARKMNGKIEREKRSIKHTQACIKSAVNEGGGVVNCSCPIS